MATIGRKRTNSRNRVKNRPKLPTEGRDVPERRREVPHDDGRKSRWSEVTMMTKRSNHMPMLTKIETTKSTGMLVRRLLEPEHLRHITLQVTMIQ
jgi:hypothetical protein